MTPPGVVIGAATAGLWAEISPVLESGPADAAVAGAAPEDDLAASAEDGAPSFAGSLAGRLDASLAKLAAVTSELASFRFADLPEPVVKEALVALDG